jgi:hypothetical protein
MMKLPSASVAGTGFGSSGVWSFRWSLTATTVASATARTGAP